MNCSDGFDLKWDIPNIDTTVELVCSIQKNTYLGSLFYLLTSLIELFVRTTLVDYSDRGPGLCGSCRHRGHCCVCLHMQVQVSVRSICASVHLNALCHGCWLISAV